jgi:hypothetical protein
VWGWGYNYYRQLGNTACSPCATPVQVSGLSNVVAISAGAYHSLALRSDHTVWAFGDNTDGQLGNSVCMAYCPTPVEVGGLPNIAAVAGGYSHSVALGSDGTVWAFGENVHGQLGNTACSSFCTTPLQVSGLAGVVAISAGAWHSLALRDDRTAWGWGYNSSYRIGTTVCITCTSAVPVTGLSDIAAVAAGGYYSFAIADRYSPVGEFVTIDVQQGDPPVTTDVEGDGATPDDPVETQVSSPNGGTVTIEDGQSEVSTAPTGYSFFGEQMTITAPDATVNEPLVLVFVLDASQIPAGQSAATLAVFRNATYVLACNGAPGVADPDPCVSDRQTLPDGDAQITVLTSEASDWNLGFPAPVADAGGPYTVAEGSTVLLDATGSTGTDPLSYLWFPDLSLDDGSLAQPTYAGLDDGAEELTLQVTDATGMGASATAMVAVTNADPSVAAFSIVAPTVGQTLNVSASFTDPGTFDTHSALIDWGDGTTSPGTVTEQDGSGSVAGAHVYAHTGTYQVKVTVTDDDGGSGERISAPFSVSAALPTINIGAVSPVTERNSGTTTVRIPVTLSAAGTQPIDVRWSTGGGTASPGSDYVSASGTLRWSAGSATTRQISISIRGDVVDEPDQTFIVTLSAPVNATIGTGSSTVTIADDDPAPRIVIADSLKLEGASGTSQMIFIVVLDRRSELPVTVGFTTVDGTARAGTDYLSRSGVLTFAPGITAVPLAVTIMGDRVREPNERFTVRLSGPANASILRGTATGTIVNDD